MRDYIKEAIVGPIYEGKMIMDYDVYGILDKQTDTIYFNTETSTYDVSSKIEFIKYQWDNILKQYGLDYKSLLPFLKLKSTNFEDTKIQQNKEYIAKINAISKVGKKNDTDEVDSEFDEIDSENIKLAVDESELPKYGGSSTYGQYTSAQARQELNTKNKTDKYIDSSLYNETILFKDLLNDIGLFTNINFYRNIINDLHKNYKSPALIYAEINKKANKTDLSKDPILTKIIEQIKLYIQSVKSNTTLNTLDDFIKIYQSPYKNTIDSILNDFEENIKRAIIVTVDTIIYSYANRTISLLNLQNKINKVVVDIKNSDIKNKLKYDNLSNLINTYNKLLKSTNDNFNIELRDIKIANNSELTNLDISRYIKLFDKAKNLDIQPVKLTLLCEDKYIFDLNKQMEESEFKIFSNKLQTILKLNDIDLKKLLDCNLDTNCIYNFLLDKVNSKIRVSELLSKLNYIGISVSGTLNVIYLKGQGAMPVPVFRTHSDRFILPDGLDDLSDSNDSIVKITSGDESETKLPTPVSSEYAYKTFNLGSTADASQLLGVIPELKNTKLNKSKLIIASLIKKFDQDIDFDISSENILFELKNKKELTDKKSEDFINKLKDLEDSELINYVNYLKLVVKITKGNFNKSYNIEDLALLMRKDDIDTKTAIASVLIDGYLLQLNLTNEAVTLYGDNRIDNKNIDTILSGIDELKLLKKHGKLKPEIAKIKENEINKLISYNKDGFMQLFNMFNIIPVDIAIPRIIKDTDFDSGKKEGATHINYDILKDIDVSNLSNEKLDFLWQAMVKSVDKNIPANLKTKMEYDSSDNIFSNIKVQFTNRFGNILDDPRLLLIIPYNFLSDNYGKTVDINHPFYTDIEKYVSSLGESETIKLTEKLIASIISMLEFNSNEKFINAIFSKIENDKDINTKFSKILGSSKLKDLDINKLKDILKVYFNDKSYDTLEEFYKLIKSNKFDTDTLSKLKSLELSRKRQYNIPDFTIFNIFDLKYFTNIKENATDIAKTLSIIHK